MRTRPISWAMIGCIVPLLPLEAGPGLISHPMWCTLSMRLAGSGVLHGGDRWNVRSVTEAGLRIARRKTKRARERSRARTQLRNGRYFGTFFGTLGAKRLALVRLLLPDFVAAARFAGRFAFFAAILSTPSSHPKGIQLLRCSKLRPSWGP